MARTILKYNESTGEVEEHSKSTSKKECGLLIKQSGPGLKWTSKHGAKLKK